MFKTNEYFDGKVKSIAFTSEKGAATVGVMAAGEYVFGTSTREYMTVTSGSMQIKLPDCDEWKTFETNETFVVEANKKFGVKVGCDVSYICIYE